MSNIDFLDDLDLDDWSDIEDDHELTSSIVKRPILTKDIMAHDFLISRINVYDVDDFKNMKLIEFINQNNVYREMSTFKVGLSHRDIFELVKSKLEAEGEVVTEFTFFASSFYLRTSNVMVFSYYDTTYDRYGNDMGHKGKYDIVLHSPRADVIANVRNNLETHLRPLETYSIMWSFSDSNGGVNTKEIFIEDQEPLIKEFYPWLPTPTVQEYFKNYLESPDTILLLVGVPGTGKTTFIRNMITENKLNTDITYDDKLIRSDSFFLRFINDKSKDIMVIEDADNMLVDREEEENFLLKKILNISDGLVKNEAKKIIFSTNITDTERIDPALIRPGRCYDVLDFRKLTSKEAQAVVDAKGLDRKIEDKEYTIAEIFSSNGRKQNFRSRKMGF